VATFTFRQLLDLAFSIQESSFVSWVQHKAPKSVGAAAE
jgi:hypothetical protein